MDVGMKVVITGFAQDIDPVDARVLDKWIGLKAVVTERDPDGPQPPANRVYLTPVGYRPDGLGDAPFFWERDGLSLDCDHAPRYRTDLDRGLMMCTRCNMVGRVSITWTKE